MTVTRTELLPQVFLRTVETTKFKSAFLSISLKTPLHEETATQNALLPWVLRRGTQTYRDMEQLSAALDDLYGGSIEPVVRKRGETQSVGLVASFLDDAYTLDQSALLEDAVALMGEIMLNPLTEDGVFSDGYVSSEKQNLTQKIKGMMNNKRQYAVSQLTKLMCSDEAYGVERLGSQERVEEITPDSLWKRYQTLLETSEIEIYHCGSAPHARVEQAVKQLLTKLPKRGEVVDCPCEIRITAPEEPNFHSQPMDVTQGKLVMGYRTGGVTVWEEDYPALVLANAIFGGTSMSKLFMNVRERLSLCYYASASIDRQKGIMLVSSGIEFEKFDQAKSEITAQLQSVQQGDITSDELEGARRIVVDSLRTTADSQDRLEDYWHGQSVIGMDADVTELISALERATKQQVVDVAQKIKLDTIYFLKGLEG